MASAATVRQRLVSGSSLLLLLSVALLSVGLLAREVPAKCWEPGGQPSRFSAQFAIDDFDGDHRPDLATVRVNRSGSHITDYSIHLQFAFGNEAVIGIAGPNGGLEILSRDVNGDRFEDLVLRTALESNLVAVLLNDGHGKFTVADPAAFPGLEKEPGAQYSGETRRVTERISLMPPRSSIGEEAGESFGVRVQATTKLTRKQPDRAIDLYLTERSSGRAPPSFSAAS